MNEQEQKAFDQMREALKAVDRAGLELDDYVNNNLTSLQQIVDQALTAANAVSHQNSETTPVPEGGAITSESAANAVSEQAQGDAWKPDFEHLANEWADAATNGPTILDNVRDGIYSFEKAKEMMAADFAHCREVGAKVRSANPQATEPAGWKLVPVEPTDAMASAAMDYVYQHGFTRTNGPYAVYRAMLASAPEAHHGK